MKSISTLQLHNLIVGLFGPLLLAATVFAAFNLLSTYNNVEKLRQGSLWNTIQLHKELYRVHYTGKEYVHDHVSKHDFRVAYEVLWSRIPLAIESLSRDRSIQELDNDGVRQLINYLFDHVKTLETQVMSSEPIDHHFLEDWIDQLENFQQLVNTSLLHNMTSFNNEYSQKSTMKIANAAMLLGLLVVGFILYLGYLMSMLWNEQKRSQLLLDHDSLTKLHSRDFILRQLDDYCQSCTPITLVAFDLNKFKQVNDTLGHHAGDELLKHFSRKLRGTLCEQGAAGRMGGDEFIWISEVTDKSLVNHYYGEFLLALKQPCSVGEERIQVSVSAGAGLSTECDFDKTHLLECVDGAMYEAKRRGLQAIYWSGTLVSPPDKEKRPKPMTAALPA